MLIPKTDNDMSFGMKFYLNKNFQEVVDYATRNKKLFDLDYALNRLSKVEAPDVVIIHGKDSLGRIYSSFSSGQKSVRNNAFAVNSPAQASFYAIMELVQDNCQKLLNLTGKKELNINIKPEEIINKYTNK